MIFPALFIGLTLIGAISPLLTFAALIQQKEWRLDRLREHLRRDGWFNQLFGTVRPAILGLYILTWIVLFNTLADESWASIGYLIGSAFLTQAAFAALTVLQLIMRKQRKPIWTSKAMLIVALSLIINLLITISTPALFPFLPFLVLLQPAVVFAAWLITYPLDIILKKRVMDRAAALRASLTNATVIGIAGSVGKTTVKELIAHLTQDLKPVVTPAHVNTEMGVANWIINAVGARRVVPLLIVEMGSYRKGEIATLCRIAQPTIGVMTALGSDHLALFGSEQNIIDANGELIAALPKDGHAFFYADNDGCRELAKRARCPITIADATGTISHTLQGHHNDYNVALATAVARHMGIKDDRIKELLQTFKPQAHTFQITSEKGIAILDDTYNISPLSLRAAIDWAAARPERPRVLLTSGLQETGPDERKFLHELGAYAHTRIERVIFTTPHGAKDFENGYGKPVEILGKTTEHIKPGSLLLAVGRMSLSTIQKILP